jgi:hypothetical protein
MSSREIWEGGITYALTESMLGTHNSQLRSQG